MTSDKSSVQVGREFEQSVATALRLQGYSVTPEQQVGHKKVDLLATKRRFGNVITTAVECKALNHNLRKDELVGIWADYQPLLGTTSIQELLVVTESGFSASAHTYTNELPLLFLRPVLW